MAEQASVMPSQLRGGHLAMKTVLPGITLPASIHAIGKSSKVCLSGQTLFLAASNIML
jgi:hypothetical protein